MQTPSLYPGFRNPLLGAPRRDFPSHVAIVGAGTIGPDIGYYLKSAIPESRLTLIDISEAALASARTRLEGYAEKAVKRGKMTADVIERVLENIVTSSNYDALAGADLVIEAASENIELKKRIFAMIEERVAPEAVITSNTSSIPASVIFANVAHPGRTTVTHFFAPAWRNPAVEVITWAKAERATVDYLRWLFAVTGKTPIVSADAVCFILDRIFDNWCNEAVQLLDRANAKQIDRVAEDFAAVGPFFVLNMANGNPIITETNTRQMQEGACYRPAPIFESVDRWLLAKPGTTVDVPSNVRSAVRDRLLGILCSQSLDILAREIGTAEDLNLGCTLALGFKKGPLDLMAAMGPAEVRRVLDRFEVERPGFPGRAALPDLETHLSFRRYVLVDCLGDVVLLTIRRPAQLNALTDEVTNELLTAIRKHEDDPAVKGFVITGFGTRAFCAGADIGRFTEMLGDAEAATRYARDCSQLLVHLDKMTKPVVAAVNGLALGGGTELATRCHEIVASSKAYFQLPEVTLGILPGIGGVVVPYRRWPHAAQTWTAMITRGERLKARDAAAIGLVTALEDDYEALVRLAAERARALAGTLPLPTLSPEGAVAPDTRVTEAIAADGSPLSKEVITIILEAIKSGLGAPDLDTALEGNYRAFGRVATTAAAKEGIGAFLAGRKPDFTGM